MSRARRRWRRSGCGRSGSALADAAGRTRRRDQCRGHPGDDRRRQAARPRHPRFDPDAVDRPRRFGAGHGHAGARLGAGDDPLRQVDRRRGRAGRPRHQGRPDRRPARRRAHGRRRALFRGRRRPPLPHPARREEPLRPDRRDRRVRDVGQGPARGRQPVRAVPRRAPRQGARRRGLRRHGGHAAGAGRDPGAGRALAARHAAPRRRRLGLSRGSPWCWPCSRRIAACGFGTHDVYLNVAGGYRISEPAADLAVAAALVSSLTGLALPADCVYFGEISLSGAIRPVAHAQQRLKEAEKLGFGQAVLPQRRARNWSAAIGCDVRSSRRRSPILSCASPGRCAARRGRRSS